MLKALYFDLDYIFQFFQCSQSWELFLVNRTAWRIEPKTLAYTVKESFDFLSFYLPLLPNLSCWMLLLSKLLTFPLLYVSAAKEMREKVAIYKWNFKFSQNLMLNVLRLLFLKMGKKYLKFCFGFFGNSERYNTDVASIEEGVKYFVTKMF